MSTPRLRPSASWKLSRLQRQFDSGVDEIKTLEQDKVLWATAAAIMVGVLGTALIAGSMLCFIAGYTLFSIILAIPGSLGRIAPYFFYRAIRTRKSAEIMPIINRKYDEIHAVCERACQLLQSA